MPVTSMGVSGRQTVVVFDAVAELSLGSLVLVLVLLRSRSLISSFSSRRRCESVFVSDFGSLACSLLWKYQKF